MTQRQEFFVWRILPNDVRVLASADGCRQVQRFGARVGLGRIDLQRSAAVRVRQPVGSEIGGTCGIFFEVLAQYPAQRASNCCGTVERRPPAVSPPPLRLRSPQSFLPSSPAPPPPP